MVKRCKYLQIFSTLVTFLFRKKDGILYPSKANMYLVPIQIEALYYQKVGFWNNVYGINMSDYMYFYNSKAFFSQINFLTTKSKRESKKIFY